VELVILHTNDIHSNYENFSKIVSKIKELKNDNTIILDAGDFADFKRIELQGTGGMAALELLEYTEYDAIAVGNNETFNGLDILINMASESKVPFLSSNLYKIGHEDIEGLKKSRIIEKNGLRILTIGLSPDLGEFNTLNGIEAEDALKAVKLELSKNAGKYDICVILSHLGIKMDRRIAEEIEEVHIIIGGHTHLLMEEPEIINNKIIHTSGCYGQNLGVLKVEITDNKVELLEGQNINIEDLGSCKEIIDILKTNKEKALDKLSTPLYDIAVDLWHDVIEENPMTNLLADALIDVLKCDIGIVNSGVIYGGIRKGAVSQKKLLEICNSPLNPTYFEIQGKYLREALQQSLDSDLCLSDGKGPGFRGKYLGRLHVSNILVEYKDRNITEIFIKGEKLEEDKWYSVATSDNLHRGTGYTSLANNKNVKYNKEYLRDILREYINKKEFIEKAFTNRWILKL
jgi:2',3'-cyclic-nucleotide 2'-phosphodiesterase (5'-nucleotidase family)